MHSIGAVLVKPENSMYSYDIAQNAAMHYNTGTHYTYVSLQNVNVMETFGIGSVASLKLLYEVDGASGIVNDLAGKYSDNFYFPSTSIFAYISPDQSRRIKIDKIIDIDDYHCDILCEALITPLDIDYCTEVKSWSWWGSSYFGKEDPAEQLSGATVRELKANGLSDAIIKRFELMIDDDMNDVSIADVMMSNKYDDHYFVMIDFHH